MPSSSLAQHSSRTWNSLHLAPGWGNGMEDLAWEIFMGQDWKYLFMFHWLESSHIALSNWKRAEKYRLSVSSEEDERDLVKH